MTLEQARRHCSLSKKKDITEDQAVIVLNDIYDMFMHKQVILDDDKFARELDTEIMHGFLRVCNEDPDWHYDIKEAMFEKIRTDQKMYELLD